MFIIRFRRALSAFDDSNRRWAPISSQIQVTQNISLPSRNIDSPSTPSLSLVSWNIDAFSSRPTARAKCILGHILDGLTSPDIVSLQEVTPGVRVALLDDARVRAAFMVTDAEDETSFEGVPFATMLLLSRARFAAGLDSQKEGDGVEAGKKFMPAGVCRVALPSKYKRDALCVDVIPPTTPGAILRLINVHLDSLGDTLPYRAQQMEILAKVLREPGCGGGVIAGDFNAFSPEDGRLVDNNRLIDAWVALHGSAEAGGATWGVGVERRDGLGPARLDKVAMTGLRAT